MLRCFEDDYVDLQSNIISLNLELIKEQINYICVYIYLKNDERYFNAFYVMGSEIYEFNRIDVLKDIRRRFLVLVNEEIDKMIILFRENKMPCPTQIKMIYEVNNGNYTFEQLYEDQLPTEITAEEMFYSWLNSFCIKYS